MLIKVRSQAAEQLRAIREVECVRSGELYPSFSNGLFEIHWIGNQSLKDCN